MPVGGITHAKHAPVLHAGRIHIVHRPCTSAQQFDLEIRLSYQLARDRSGPCLVDYRGWLVDVIAPDDQPFVPGSDHTNQAHADSAYFCARLHDRIQNGGAMRDKLGQIGSEPDIHGPSHTHLPFEWQTSIPCDTGIPSVRANQVFRADGEFFSGQFVAALRNHTVVGLRMAQVLRTHPCLRTASASRLEQKRLHESLRKIVHPCRTGQSALCPGKGMCPPTRHATDFLPHETLTEYRSSHQILIGRVQVSFLFYFLSKIAENLHRA